MTRRQADALLLAATAIWGVSFPVVKTGLGYATPLAFLAVRFSIASLLLAPATRFQPRPSRGEIAGGLLLALLLSAGFATQATGLVYTTPSRSAFIVAISSVLAPAVAFVVLGQRMRWWTVGALALAGGGIYLLTAPDTGGLNRGDLWTFGCAVAFGGHIVAVAELSTRYDARRLVWMQIAGTAAGTALAGLLLEDMRIRWTPAFGLALAYLVLGATVIALLWQMHAQRHMTAARAALIFCLEPVFAAGTSWLWLGERLSLTQWLGGGLILLGMVVADLPFSRQSSRVSYQQADP